MRCYRRWRPNHEVFYIDEFGNEVSEEIAKRHLVDETGYATKLKRVLGESERAAGRFDALKAAAMKMGMTETRAILFARGPREGGTDEADWLYEACRSRKTK